jgi:hypothetical protein
MVEAGNAQEQTCLIKVGGEQPGEFVKLYKTGGMERRRVLKKGSHPVEQDNDMKEEVV